MNEKKKLFRDHYCDGSSYIHRVPSWQMYVRQTDEKISNYLGSRHKIHLHVHALWSPTVQIIMIVVGISLSVLFYCIKPPRQTSKYKKSRQKSPSSTPVSSSSLSYDVIVGIVMVMLPIVISSVYFYLCDLHQPIYRSYVAHPESLTSKRSEL